MAIFPALGIGRQALLTHQAALQTIGQNVANVNTPGYSRQRTVLEAVPPSGGAFGGGVRAVGIERFVDSFIEARRLANASAFGAATTSRDLLQRVEAGFPITGGGIGDALQQFFNAANGVANDPESLAARGDLLAAAERLAVQIRGGAEVLHSYQREADNRIAQEVQDANALLQRVGALNREIVAARVAGVSENELRDARQETLGRLAEKLEINVVEQADGAVNVFAAPGMGLVLGANAVQLASPLGAQPALDGGALRRVGIVGQSGAFLPIGAGLGGSVGALLTLRDQTLAANAAELDALATTLRDAVNTVQTDAGGRDLDGLVGTDFLAGTGAADLTVALVDPRGIAAGLSANPGDNANALALTNLQGTPFAGLGGQTLGGYFGTFHARIGDQTRSATEQASIQEHVALTLEAQRDAISGVSLEEEFTDLIRFQRAFQAAAQLISVSDRLLDDLLGLVR
jgi:flagellar hook-associated protein 1 FlgK